jgi:hypothetical protein
MSTLICGEKKLDKANLCCFDHHPLLSHGSGRAAINPLTLNKPLRTDANENPFIENLQITDPAGRDSEQRAIRRAIHLVYILTPQNGAASKPRQPISRAYPSTIRLHLILPPLYRESTYYLTALVSGKVRLELWYRQGQGISA